MFSGAISDWIGKRKLLAVLGYGLAALTKPAFPLAPTVGWLIAARLVDRIGKGIRGAPRDALVADLAPAHLRGASFGLRQSLDTMGAFIGPLLAIALMWLTANDFTTVFWIAVVPAFLALALIVFAVHEPRREPALRKVRFPLHRDELARLGRTYWLVVAVATVFTVQDVPAELYEAAMVDGARPWHRIRHITIPTIAPLVQAFQAAKVPLAAIDLPEIAQRNLAALFEQARKAHRILIYE